MDIKTLNAQTRESTGKGAARTLRREGKMPAVVYSSGSESMPLSVSTYQIEQLLKKVNYYQVLINLVVGNGTSVEKTVMIKELQTDPVTRKFLHIDFYEVKMDQKITTTIPLVFTGTSRGVDAGGILQVIRREVEVACLPTRIPPQIEIDITDLDIGDSIHVEEISAPSDVEILYDANFTVATVASPKREEAAEEAEEEGEEEGEAKDAAEQVPEE